MNMDYNRVVLGTTIVWAAVILGTAVVLKGTGYFTQLIPILGAGSAGNLIVASRTRKED